MTVLTSIAVPFGCVMLMTLVRTSTARTVWMDPDEEPGEFPFEFSTTKGSKVTADNVLTQSVSSDGGTVFNTNDPQPIKKYQFGGRKDAVGEAQVGGQSAAKPAAHGSNAQSTTRPNRKIVYVAKPPGKKLTTVHNHPARSESSTSVSSEGASPSAASQWDVIENLYRYMYPGTTGIKITYRYT